VTEALSPDSVSPVCGQQVPATGDDQGECDPDAITQSVSRALVDLLVSGAGSKFDPISGSIVPVASTPENSRGQTAATPGNGVPYKSAGDRRSDPGRP
jgi:hypothetical protein